MNRPFRRAKESKVVAPASSVTEPVEDNEGGQTRTKRRVVVRGVTLTTSTLILLVVFGLPWVWWRLPRFDVRGTGWSRLGSVCTIWGVAVQPGNAVIADSQSGSGRSCQTAPVLSLWRSQR